MSIKLSVEAYSKALTTKLFMMTRSLKRQVMLSWRKRRVLLRCCALVREVRMGMRALMMLQSLKIQMKRILVPLLKIQSKGISPCLQVWYSSQLLLSFIMQLYSGISSSSRMNSSSFSARGSISLCLNFEGFVKVFIFLFRIMSHTSYFDILEIQIRLDIIFSLRAQLVFYYSCFITTFRNGYYEFWAVFQRNSSRVPPIASLARLSVSSPIFLSYLWSGSSLNSEETSFITILIQPIVSNEHEVNSAYHKAKCANHKANAFQPSGLLGQI